MTEIIQKGDPILKKTAQLVNDIGNQKIQDIIDKLIITAQESHGVGIAAPQIGESYRIFVITSHPNPRYPDAPFMPPTAIINPRIISHSEKMVKGWEGCLSVCGKRGLVSRYQAIAVEYFTREGKLEKKEFTDFIARVFQHELDHLDGILFIDRITNSEDIYSEEEYEKLYTRKIKLL